MPPLVVCHSVVGAAIHAASINFEVQVPGYSGAAWVKVGPELRAVLGGKLAFFPQYGGWVTDRVSRGETMRIAIFPDRARESRCRGALVGVSAADGYADFGLTSLPVTGA